jgi:hypothetical protein
LAFDLFLLSKDVKIRYEYGPVMTRGHRHCWGKPQLVWHVFEYSLSAKPYIEHVELGYQGIGRGSLSDSGMTAHRQRVFRSSEDPRSGVRKFIEGHI